jgi:hypothetical protein
MTNPTCGTCRWFRPLSQYSPPGGCLNPINDDLHPHVVKGGAVRMARVVDRRYDFCGEHQPTPPETTP